ncbi:MAG: DUF1552 domain-containing protein [Polyangiaceae bacterium]
MPTRRQFLTSAGAGLLLAPFINAGLRNDAKAAGTTAKRLLVFCSMGTFPPLWTPTVSGETISSWSAMTQPLSAAANDIVLVEGMPSGNPNDGHGAPDSLTGLGYSSSLKQSVDQFVADSLVKSGVSRPIASLLLGANCNENGGLSQFYGGSNGGNLPTIGSPLSAYSTVFGAAMPTGSTSTSTAALLKRRQSILDTVSAEITGLKSTLGSNEKAKLDAHLDSIRQLENKLMSSGAAGAGGCTKPATPGADSTFQFMGDLDAMAANLIHQQIIVSAFACDITRVACLEYGNDQKLMVNAMGIPYDDQHGGFIHSGAASNYANLVLFEAYLATQFVNIINALKAVPDPLGSNGQTLFDNTLMVWARDMGDAQNHNQQSMRFVLASGNGGYLKTATGGRYVSSTERHERILLNVCEAMGITSYTGFGDPVLPTKQPLPGISALA